VISVRISPPAITILKEAVLPTAWTEYLACDRIRNIFFKDSPPFV
jgi:hypothetical protein